jgi:tetratricopeptide (TPR) repeat protein
VRRPVVLALGLLLLTLLSYLPALDNGFVWDDDDYVTANATLRSADGLRRIWLEPGAVPQYYPLTFTTLWLNYQIGGLEPFGYHLTNVLLHALAAILAWLGLRALGVPGAWIAGALFAVHPVHVESVAWISERKNVLSGVLYLGAMLAYLRFAGLDDRTGIDAANRPRGRRGAYALSLALFVGGLLAKTVVCTLPAALLLLVWWKRGRVTVRDVVPLVPFFAVGAALALVTVQVERRFVGAVGGDWDLTFLERCLIAGRAVWFYIGKLVWPANLTFFYPRWTIDARVAWQYAFPAAALATAAVLLALRRRIGGGPLVALLFFVATLGPALGFVDVFPMRYSFVADHFQYLASLGPIALAAALAVLLARRLGVTTQRIALGAAAGVVVVLAVLTARQTESYRDLRTLWTDTLARNPGAWMAHNNLGLLLVEEGRPEAAMEHFRAAIASKPDDAFARNNLGRALAAAGRLDEAIALFLEAVRIELGNAEAWSNLGNAYAAQGRYGDAADAYRRAIAARPSFADAYSNLGNVMLLTGRGDEAIALYREALRLDPGFADAQRNLAVALAQRDRGEDPAAAGGGDAINRR